MRLIVRRPKLDVMNSILRRSVRLLLALLVPGLATFAAWWLFLGLDANDNYSVPQCSGLILVLIAIGFAAALPARGLEIAAVIVSAGAGISIGCFTSWMDDETGMFVVGWMMLTPPAFLCSGLVVWWTTKLRDSVAGQAADKPAIT